MTTTNFHAFRNNRQNWQVSNVISFDYYFNEYIKSRTTVESIILHLSEQIGIDSGDTSQWADDIRFLLGHCITCYLSHLEDYDGDIDECNTQLTGQLIIDGIWSRDEARCMVSTISDNLIAA